jgi:transcriptional regulator of arginine metabolism
MKNKRQEKIVSLITRYEIETQEELIGMLNKEGFRVTQATVSRDIRELKLVKVTTGHGGYRYMLPPQSDSTANVKFNSALAESIISADFASNIVVVKTYPGLANAVATGIDSLKLTSILGCVAGDDTIIIVVSDIDSARDISERIRHLIKA